ASFEAALALRPSPELRLNRGVALARLDRPREALADYDAVVEADPGCAKAHASRAGALNDLARPAEALAAADRALALDPTLADAHNNRGVALYDLRRLDE